METQLVERDNSLPRSPTGRFRATLWSVVLLSAQSQAPGSEAALAEFCRLYWYPIYAFVRYRGYPPHDAQDLTQSFFLHLLEHKALTHVDPLRGKFRSFLLASVQIFSRMRRTVSAVKREEETGNLCAWTPRTLKNVIGSSQSTI